MGETGNGPVVRMAELEIDPGRIDAYVALLREEVEASVRLEPGVIMLHAVAPRGSPGSIRLLEAYADAAAYEAHLRSPHFLRYKALSAGMVLSLRLVEADPVILRAKPWG